MTITITPATDIQTFIQETEAKAQAITWESFYTEPYEGQKDEEEVTWTERCGKCAGTGYIRAFGHVDAGLCYDCRAYRSTYQVTSTVGKERAKAVKRAKARVKAERAHLRKFAKLEQDRAAELARFTTGFPIINLVLETRGEGLEKALNLGGWQAERITALWIYAQNGLELDEVERAALILTQAVAEKMVAEATAAGWAQTETREDVPTADGLVITGRVVTVTTRESRYGTTWKMVLEAEGGFKLWGTIPAPALKAVDSPQDLREKLVTFTANVEPSGDDPKFGFFSRPRKITVQN